MPLHPDLRGTGRCIVAIPAHNEEHSIGSLVAQCRMSTDEVWVVDDGSTDATAENATKSGARVLRHETNLGKGRAIRTALDAFLREESEYLLFLDGDGQHDPAVIPSFIKLARSSGAGIILGNRLYAPGNMPPIRQWTNYFMSWLISEMAGQEIADSQCGYRLLSRNFVRQFKPTTDHFELESEMLIQAGRFGSEILSVPIPVIYRGSSSHIKPLRDTLRFARMAWRYLGVKDAGKQR